jgi:hypothetical protein
MMRYDDYMRTRSKSEMLKDEVDKTMSLIWKLVDEPDYESHYAAHSETGVVYDKRILGDKIGRLNKEIAELENRIENDKQ